MSYYGAADSDLKWWQLKKKAQAKKEAGTLPSLDVLTGGGSVDPSASVSTVPEEGLPAWVTPVGIVATIGLLGVAAYFATRDEV